MNEKKQLTGKQRAFCREYVNNGLNGLEAARAAGYKGSDDTLKSTACRNITKDYLKAEIDRLLADRRVESKVNRLSLERKLDDAYDVAKTKSDSSGMVAAVRAQAKLYGLETNKQEREHGVTDSLSELLKEIGASGAGLPIKGQTQGPA